MDDRRKNIYIDIAFTILFLLAFIAAYYFLSIPTITDPMQILTLGTICAILLVFAIFFFFTLLNQIFS